MRRRKFSLNQKHKIAVLTLVLLITGGGIIHHNPDAEAMDVEQISQQVSQKELDMVFGKQIKTIDIFPKINENKINSNKSVKPEYNIKLSQVNSDLIWKLCEKNNLSYELALAVFHKESGFNYLAININKNHTRDEGLCQLNSRFTNTYKMYAIEFCDYPENKPFDVFNSEDNIRAGIGTLVYLRNYWQQRGIPDELMIDHITGSWNLGIEGFKKYVKQTGKTEREYSRQVLSRKIKLEQNHTLT